MNNPNINECCKIEENLKEIEQRPVIYNDGGNAGVLVVKQCQVCLRKHYEHQVNPITVGVVTK